MTLPDSTIVTLNAASVLRFPSAFNDSERRVELTGEAYFEVAKDRKKPFIVKLNRGTKIQVLGTHFNVNAYEDEPDYITTLIEGAVKITNGRDSLLLTPGQQASIDKNEHLAPLEKSNIRRAMAWTDDMFNFKDQNFDVVIRQLARWYDFEPVYRENIPNHQMEIINVSRTDSLASILDKMRSVMPFHYHIDGKKVTFSN